MRSGQKVTNNEAKVASVNCTRSFISKQLLQSLKHILQDFNKNKFETFQTKREQRLKSLKSLEF